MRARARAIGVDIGPRRKSTPWLKLRCVERRLVFRRFESKQKAPTSLKTLLVAPQVCRMFWAPPPPTPPPAQRWLHELGLPQYFPLIVALSVLIVLHGLLMLYQQSRGTKVELHAYQKRFLGRLGAKSSQTAAGALTMIVRRAMKDRKVKAEIFDQLQCVHCGSVKPAAWVKEHKGKQPYSLALDQQVRSFLTGSLLLACEKRGEPPQKQLVDGPRAADMHKAARCCVDWAIKAYDAVADGEPKEPKGENLHLMFQAGRDKAE